MSEQETTHQRLRLRLDVGTYRRMVQHHDAMARELALVRLGGGPRAAEAGAVLDGLAVLRDRWSPVTLSLRAALNARLDGPDDLVDLSVEVSGDLVAWAEAFLEAFTAADRFFRSEDMLTVASSDDIVAFRQWLVDEIAGQLGTGDHSR